MAVVGIIGGRRWRDVVMSALSAARQYEAARMKSDPKYRADREALLAEYDRIFNPPKEG